MGFCSGCHVKLNWYQQKYCSNKCQSHHQYRKFIQEWKNGKKSGGVGVFAKNVSGHVRRYLSEKYGDKCSLCGWHRRNIITHKVPLEIDHIDGDSENNSESNLRLICPNCHALSANFRNLNKGKGRSWRKDKYLKHASYAIS